MVCTVLLCLQDRGCVQGTYLGNDFLRSQHTISFLLMLPTPSQDRAELYFPCPENENNPEVKSDLVSDRLKNWSLLSQVSG